MNRVYATLAVMASLTASVEAGGLHKEWVAHDATWILHVDVEAAMDSTLGRALLSEESDIHLDFHELEEIEHELGLDLREDLLSVTLYGTETEPDEVAVAIAVMTPEADEAMETLVNHEEVDVRESVVDGRTFHVIHDGGEKCYIHMRQGEEEDERIVLISEHRRAILDALDVIEGEASNMADEEPAGLAGVPRSGSIAFLAATNVGTMPDMHELGQILKLSDAITIDIGERRGKTYAEGAISTADVQTARDIVEVIEGVIALGRVLPQMDPELAPLEELSEAFEVTRDGSRLTLRLQIDSVDLIEVLEEVD